MSDLKDIRMAIKAFDITHKKSDEVTKCVGCGGISNTLLCNACRNTIGSSVCDCNECKRCIILNKYPPILKTVLNQIKRCSGCSEYINVLQYEANNGYCNSCINKPVQNGGGK